MLSHSAERALNGEIPHIDFDDPYTGLLTFLHAFAFKILGVGSDTTRYILFGISVIFIAYFMSYLWKHRCSVSSIICAQWLFILVAFLHYPASMPTWYTSYLGVVAGCLLIKSKEETVSRRDLIIAGLCCGLAITLKINAVVWVLASSWIVATLNLTGDAKANHSIGKLDFILLSLITFFLYAALFLPNINYSNSLYFFLPVILILCNLYRNCIKDKKSYLLTTNYLLFLVSAVLPTVIFALFYYWEDGLFELFQGVIVLPRRRVEYVSISPPSAISTFFIIALTVMAVICFKRERNINEYFLVVLGLFSQIYFNRGAVNSWSIYDALAYIPMIVSITMFMQKKTVISESKTKWIYFMVFGLLFHFPFYEAGYVGYTFIFSLIYLCLCADSCRVISCKIKLQKAFILLIASAFFLVCLNWYSDRYYNFQESSAEDLYKIVDRTRLPSMLVTKPTQLISLIAFINELKSKDSKVIAFPDSPEIYFYLNARNPLPVIYNIFSLDWSDYHKYHQYAVSNKIPFVVIWTGTPVSPPVDSQLIQMFKDSYEDTKRFGDYLLFWNMKIEANL